MAAALVVLAHPLQDSLCGHFAGVAGEALAAAGHTVTLLDLCRDGFDPRLGADERAAYYRPPHVSDGIRREAALLAAAETLVLVFPTWWFGPPAVMKGFFDRVFAPGIAFAHGEGFGPIRPLLTGLRRVIVVTTLGSPWWVDRLVMGRPVRRMIRRGIIAACAPQARFRYLPFASAEAPSAARVETFAARLRRTLADPGA